MGENVAVFYHRQVKIPSVSGINNCRLNTAIKPGFITSFHVRQNSLHTMIGTKFAECEERKSLQSYFTIGRSEVSTMENLVVIWRNIVYGSEKAKLVNVLFCCLMKYPESDSSVEVFGAADVVKPTQRISIAG